MNATLFTRQLSAEPLIDNAFERHGVALRPPENSIPPAVPGGLTTTREQGASHSGAYISRPTLGFAGLALSNTDVTGHHTYRTDEKSGPRFVIEAPR